MTVLVLGGTGEARALASALVAADVDVVSSLAGRVARPALPEGRTRVGGFGGVEGLSGWLSAHRVAVVVDATHPFAARISANAVAACAATGVPLLRLARPGWGARPDAGAWHWVDDTAAAASVAARLGGGVLLTTGRQGLEAFVPALRDAAVVARVVDPPEVELPPSWTVLQDRGPYTVEGETALLRARHVRVLVTKDSGGSLTSAKLDAAAALGVEVVVVRRPDRSGAPSVATVDEAVAWALTGVSG
ncbi:cobalt-precorrin-6A reductase [Solicola sp. PLA-1-18]|uniref:cobalt-precorrin-6A reductase n=1 Tax=Solicola sp. PLA-1-18 TaxID=3380532 RepID=UPI003B77403B